MTRLSPNIIQGRDNVSLFAQFFKFMTFQVIAVQSVTILFQK